MELRIRDMPDELYEWLQAEGKRKGLTVRSLVLASLWGTKEGQYHGTKPGQESPENVDKSGTVGQKEGQKRDKFIPPTLEEARAEIAAKGYPFTAEAFVAHYENRGWKLPRAGVMKSWQRAMVSWNEKAKQDQQLPLGGGHGEQRRVSPAEERSQQSKRNILDAIRAARGSGDTPDDAQQQVAAPKRIVD